MAIPIPSDAATRPLLIAVLAKVGPIEISHQELGEALLDVATDRVVLATESTAGGVRLIAATTT